MNLDMAEGKTVFHDESILDRKRQKQSGKLDADATSPDAQFPNQPCPNCGGSKLYHDGLRYLKDGSTVQRWLCRLCSYRFSQSNEQVHIGFQLSKMPHSKANHFKKRIVQADLSVKEVLDSSFLSSSEDSGVHEVTNTGKSLFALCPSSSNRQVCVNRSAKNLTSATETKTVVEEKKQPQETAVAKGKILELCLYMKRQNYSDETIRLNRIALKVLSERGADLFNPESVKDVISRQAWSDNRRRNVINAYDMFLKLNSLTWEKPRCTVTRSIPFIPTEQELDALISASGKKLSAFLLLLKETAMRRGEAKRIEWINVDSERNTVTLNDPEKKSNPRMWKVSARLIAQLNALPKNNVRVFGSSSIDSMKSMFLNVRKKLAVKLQNPRLLNINFHGFRHWKATMLYHQTKDPYYVKDFLGHKSLKNTEIYITVEHTLFGETGNDEFIVKVAEKPEEIKGLLEVGFEYVCQKDSLIFLRKRK